MLSPYPPTKINPLPLNRHINSKSSQNPVGMIYNVTINKINNPIKRFISLRFISFRIFNCNLLALTNKNRFEC